MNLLRRSLVMVKLLHKLSPMLPEEESPFECNYPFLDELAYSYKIQQTFWAETRYPANLFHLKGSEWDSMSLKWLVWARARQIPHEQRAPWWILTRSWIVKGIQISVLSVQKNFH